VSREARNDRDAENRETVQKPLMAYILSKGLQGINSRFSVWDLAKWADEGEQIAQFNKLHLSIPKCNCSLIPIPMYN